MTRPTSSMAPIARSLRSTLLVLGVGGLACTTGCVVVSEGVPEVQICSPSPPAECSVPVRYKPYAAALDRVLRQEARVTKELRRRDWEEVSDELGEWQGYVRRLAGVAETTHNPAALRGYCERLEQRIDTMRRAGRNRDADVVEQELDAIAPILNRLSREFPLTEPVDAPATPEVER